MLFIHQLALVSSYLRSGATASTFPMRTAIWQMPMVRARARTGSLRDETTAIGSRNGMIPSYDSEKNYFSLGSSLDVQYTDAHRSLYLTQLGLMAYIIR